MTREAFDALIQKLEQSARRHPRAYTARIIGLIVLAYFYLLLVLFGSLALCLLMIAMVCYAPITIKFAIVGLVAFGGIFQAVLRGLWVKLTPPKGQPITRAQAPQLFALLDELRTALDCRPFHDVLIINEMNAGVVQIPRLGIFGWHRNYLVIGLPLMQSLGPDEFKAVLAHEFAHSSRGHGRFGNWLYRVRQTWAQIFEQMARRRTRWGAVLFKFLNWFWPVFNGHVFVLARVNEYEADACSVRLAGADAAASALMRTRVEGALLGEKFWPDLFVRANQEKEPPADVMVALNDTLKKGASPEDTGRWLRQAFLMETNNADTHPSLKDRLRAIGRLPDGVESGRFPEALPPSAPPTAADFYLGSHLAIVAAKISEEWHKFIAPQWAKRYEHAKKLADELTTLDQPADTPAMTRIWEKARKLVELHGDGAAVSTLEQVLTLEPKHAGANFILGRHYLETDNPRGVEFIETAITSDPALTQAGCNLLYQHFNRTGQRDKLRPLENRFDEFQKLNVLAQQERSSIKAADRFLPHELTDAQVAALVKVFEAEPAIGRVTVARKAVKHFPNNPCFAIGLTIKVSWWKPRSSDANKKLVQRVLQQVRLPGYFLVFVNEKNLKALGAAVAKTPGAVVYERK